ncbi:MAG TPA: hypothetical protein VFJ16_02145 [Longimicrobium sp.]|nr:hypothetical protein [Longimicrobium sp.]
MPYDRHSFETAQLSAWADPAIPEATFHVRMSRNGWAACSLLTPRASITGTETARLLQEMSPAHDFAAATDGWYSVPLGYAQASRLVPSFREFLSDTQPGERWRPLVVFEPHGFVIYGRWAADGGELLVQDARDSVVHTVFSLPQSRVPDWMETFGRLAVTLSASPT